jgi:hypothetical protein
MTAQRQGAAFPSFKEEPNPAPRVRLDGRAVRRASGWRLAVTAAYERPPGGAIGGGGRVNGRTMSMSYAKPGGHLSTPPPLWSEKTPRREAMEPPTPFHGATGVVDGTRCGCGSNVVEGLSSDDGVGDDGVGISDAPARRTNMAEPCSGQTPGAYSSDDERVSKRGTERGAKRGTGRSE